MNHSIFDLEADFWKAMGSAARLQILNSLRECPLNVRDIARATGLRQSLISRQLRILRSVGVVRFQRRGNEITYHLMDKNVGELCDLVRRVVSTQIQKQREAFEQEQHETTQK